MSGSAHRKLVLLRHAKSAWPDLPDHERPLAGPTSPTGGGGSGIAPPDAFERMRAKFPTAAIAVLELTGTWRQLGPGTAHLASFVIPRDVRTGKQAGR